MAVSRTSALVLLALLAAPATALKRGEVDSQPRLALAEDDSAKVPSPSPFGQAPSPSLSSTRPSPSPPPMLVQAPSPTPGINKTMQDKIDKLMIRTVAWQQLRLFELLDQADADLNATEHRIQSDLAAAKLQVQAQKDLANQTAFVNSTVLKNVANLKQLEINFPGTEFVANKTEKKIIGFNTTIADTKKAIQQSGAWIGAKMRADEGTNTMKLMRAKLDEIGHRTASMEDQLFNGNATLLVDDRVEGTMTGIIEDLGRGLVRQLPA